MFRITIGILALIRVSDGYRQEWLDQRGIGVWVFIAAFTIDHTAAATWHDEVLGIIVFLLAVSSAEARQNPSPAGGEPRLLPRRESERTRGALRRTVAVASGRRWRRMAPALRAPRLTAFRGRP